ncbi:hypothetical protein F4604DRAFT_1678591 [Suillus subluteus]|nr:hypothetical protein F4604DRAFT_1678591 [Suillus subluteus]
MSQTSTAAQPVEGPKCLERAKGRVNNHRLFGRLSSMLIQSTTFEVWLLGKIARENNIQAFATIITTDWLFEIDMIDAKLVTNFSLPHFQFYFHDEIALWSFSCYISILRTPLVSRDLPQVVRAYGTLVSDYLAHTSSACQFAGCSSRGNDSLDLDDSDLNSIASDASFSDSSTTSQSEDGDADEVDMTGRLRANILYKKTLEDTIIDLSTSEKTSETDRTTRESEVRQQEERALSFQAAEDTYLRQVVIHAESIKTIETLRQLSVAQATSRENLSGLGAANAQAKLAASEGSWKQQKEALDKEIADLNARSKDLSAQNALLHQHLETVSTQATCIRQAADFSATEGTSGDADVGGDVDTKVSELRSVVAYPRKEKEIVDLQPELNKQENVRLKVRIEHLTQSLQETRVTLAEERERAMEGAMEDAQHAKMLERINQFNILRESNVTLRADCETYAKRSRKLDAKLQALSTELEPVEEKARVAQAELQARDAQITSRGREPPLARTRLMRINWLQNVKSEQTLSNPDLKLSLLEGNFRSHKESNRTMRSLNATLETLQKEKVALEQALANERAAKAQAPVEGSLDQTALITSLKEERDKLLAEMEALSKAGSATLP